MTPYCLMPMDPMEPVLTLLQSAFATMDGVIDPPSSLHRMTPESLARDAAGGELWVMGALGHPVTCMILTPKPATLYLGKLAVAPSHRGQGLARVLVDLAIERAEDLDLPSVTLQTRVQLTGNQQMFLRMGFVETGRTAHDGYPNPTSISYRYTL